MVRGTPRGHRDGSEQYSEWAAVLEDPVIHVRQCGVQLVCLAEPEDLEHVHSDDRVDR